MKLFYYFARAVFPDGARSVAVDGRVRNLIIARSDRETPLNRAETADEASASYSFRNRLETCQASPLFSSSKFCTELRLVEDYATWLVEYVVTTLRSSFCSLRRATYTLPLYTFGRSTLFCTFGAQERRSD